MKEIDKNRQTDRQKTDVETQTRQPLINISRTSGRNQSGGSQGLTSSIMSITSKTCQGQDPLKFSFFFVRTPSTVLVIYHSSRHDTANYLGYLTNTDEKGIGTFMSLVLWFIKVIFFHYTLMRLSSGLLLQGPSYAGLSDKCLLYANSCCHMGLPTQLQQSRS